MTKEDREDEITDYIHYLNTLYETVINQVDHLNSKINIVGFSQGGATASRRIADKKVVCTNFILWSSMLPNDINFNTNFDVKAYFLYGDNDPYLTEERVLKQLELINKSNLGITVSVFKGVHDIPSKVLMKETKTNNW